MRTREYEKRDCSEERGAYKLVCDVTVAAYYSRKKLVKRCLFRVDSNHTCDLIVQSSDSRRALFAERRRNERCPCRPSAPGATPALWRRLCVVALGTALLDAVNRPHEYWDVGF